MNVQANECNLQLDDIYIEKVNFLRNEKYNPNEVELKFNLQPTVQISKDEKKCKCTFKATITDNKNNFLDIEIIVVGIFGLLNFDSLDKTTRDSLVSKNTLAILFPYLRSYITTITSQSGIKPIILPPINIAALVDSNKANGNDKQIEENQK